MKKTICFVLAFAGILIIACNNPKKDLKVNPYEGVWEMTYMEIVSPDTTIVENQFPIPSVRLLTKKHYAGGIQAGEGKIFGGGGEYTYEGDSITFYSKYGTAPKGVPTVRKFKSKMEGDLWTISEVSKNDTNQYSLKETWKRIKE